MSYENYVNNLIRNTGEKRALECITDEMIDLFFDCEVMLNNLNRAYLLENEISEADVFFLARRRIELHTLYHLLEKKRDEQLKIRRKKNG